jgi:phenylpyruvate tautomerase PptA (4-oxalocrotonate tautomerase family)
MPKSLVEVRRPYPDAEATAIMDAVHDALVSAFRIPPQDRTVRLVEHAPQRFSCSPELEHPERYTMVTIECFAGRSLDAKRRLYGELADRLAPLGIPGDHLSIILHEIELQNWGMDGGRAAIDADLGFALDV